jgi:hypothetical protein
MSEREPKQLDLLDELAALEEGFDGWDVFDDDEEEPDFLDHAVPDPRSQEIPSPKSEVPR